MTLREAICCHDNTIITSIPLTKQGYVVADAAHTVLLWLQPVLLSNFRPSLHSSHTVVSKRSHNYVVMI